MTAIEKTAEKKQVNKTRTWNNLIVLFAVLPLLLFAFRYYNDVAAFLTNTDPSQLGDLGPDILQPIFVVCLYVAAFATFSAVMAAFYERQFSEAAFGARSRFAVLFVLFFAGAAVIAGGLL